MKVRRIKIKKTKENNGKMECYSANYHSSPWGTPPFASLSLAGKFRLEPSKTKVPSCIFLVSLRVQKQLRFSPAPASIVQTLDFSFFETRCSCPLFFRRLPPSLIENALALSTRACLNSTSDLRSFSIVTVIRVLMLDLCVTSFPNCLSRYFLTIRCRILQSV